MIRKRIKFILLFLILAVIPLLFFDPSVTYISRRFVRFLIFALFAMALNIIFGETDQLILFTGGIAATGAYTTALLADYVSVSPWLTLLVGATVSGLFGALVCYIAARREFTVIVLAIVTFACQLIIHELLIGLRDITRGTKGFPFSGLDVVFLEETLNLTPLTVQFYVLTALFATVLGLYTWLKGSKYGLAFEAIRQDPFAAKATGIDIIRLKVAAGFFSTFIIGLVGPFYAQSSGIIIPSQFTFASIDVTVLIIVVLGGLRTTFGPVIGAAVIIYVSSLLSEFGQWRAVVFGLLLTFLFVYFREGMISYFRSLSDDRDQLRDRIAHLLNRRSQ